MTHTQLNLGCDYTGYEFGGGYLDSCCIEGYLWDLDSCDEPGGGLTRGGDLPCPHCNTAEFLARAVEDADSSGEAMFTPWCGAEQWELCIARAMEENPEAARAFLATVKPFTAADWPDRAAVRANQARWDNTIERTWPWPFDLTALQARSKE